MMNKSVALGLVSMLLLTGITAFCAPGAIAEAYNYTASTSDPDCDGRLWLWGPYGGWTGQLVNFTPTIGSLTRKDAWRLGECCVDFLWEFGDGDTLSFTCCTLEEYEAQKPNYVSHVYENSGSFIVKLTVSSPFLELYDTDDVIIKDANPNAPNEPSVKYKRVNNIEEYVHQYLITSEDLDNDPVRFYFEFEDGYVPWHPIPSQHGWTKFYCSGETGRIWDGTQETNGKCRIKAQDICGAESDWVVVKTKSRPQSFLPMFFQILQRMLKNL